MLGRVFRLVTLPRPEAASVHLGPGGAQCPHPAHHSTPPEPPGCHPERRLLARGISAWLGSAGEGSGWCATTRPGWCDAGGLPAATRCQRPNHYCVPQRQRQPPLHAGLEPPAPGCSRRSAFRSQPGPGPGDTRFSPGREPGRILHIRCRRNTMSTLPSYLEALAGLGGVAVDSIGDDPGGDVVEVFA